MSRPTIDVDLLYKSKFLALGTEDPSMATTDAILAAVIGLVHNRVVLAHTVLLQASDTSLGDHTENRSVSIKFAERLAEAAAFSAWFHADTRDRLTRFRPGDPVPEEHEMKLRTDFVQRLQPVVPSELVLMRDVKAVNHLESILKLAQDHPQYVNADDVAAFGKHVAACDSAYKEVLKEGRDDEPIFRDLVAARAETQSVLVAGRLVLEGILRIEKAPWSIDEFLLKAQKQKEQKDEAATATQAGTTTIDDQTI